MIEFEQLLKNAMGLDAGTIGSSAVERAVKERQFATHVHDRGEYLQRVRSSANELQELIEAVVVPETWFFRDRRAFEALARIVREDAAGSRAQLRILSVPCSTGEEPYSIAMTLLDVGLSPANIHVDAVDISARALARAARATYGKNAFRGSDFAFRDRHFHGSGERCRLNDDVRALVNFQQGNLLAADFLAGTETYDVIFCRNVLIYFDRETQDRAVNVLELLLKPNGVVFIGPAETGLLFNRSFTALGMPSAFAFRKGIVPVNTPELTTPPRPRKAVRPVPVAKAVPVKKAVPVPRKTLPAPAASPCKLDDATRLADEGQFAQAARVCENYLREHGPSAAALHLMGLIQSATGNLASAAAYFRKVLYLDPQAQETAAHLRFVLEKLGDTKAANALRNRVLRLASGEVK